MGNTAVYCHTLKLDGRKYFGITSKKPVASRWGKNGERYKDSPHFYNAIQKYGWENFDHEILETNLTREQACAEEQRLISKYNTTDDKYGFNIGIGGEIPPLLNRHHKTESNEKNRKAHLGKKMSEETKQKMREYYKEHPVYNKGKKLTEEEKAKRKPRKPVTEESRKKMSESHKGKTRTMESRIRQSVANTGRKMSKETVEKIRLSKLGKPRTIPLSKESLQKIAIKHWKPVRCVETGQIYDSVKDTGLLHIGECCNGKRKTVGGFHWEWA